MPVLQFKGKTAIENYHHTVAHHTLEFDASLSVLGKGEKPSLEGNLIIEGDNLLALKALLPTHAGQVKCIYIDPPYNTGNEGWVYNDNLTQPQFREWIGQTVGKEGEDATRHDKWCCVMYPRLQLLKELLRDDGAIFVSIGDIEVSHLRMMMEEVFGPENFVATIIWRNSTGPKQSKTLSNSHDYILCFAKRLSDWKSGREMAGSNRRRRDPRGKWRDKPAATACRGGFTPPRLGEGWRVAASVGFGMRLGPSEPQRGERRWVLAGKGLSAPASRSAILNPVGVPAAELSYPMAPALTGRSFRPSGAGFAGGGLVHPQLALWAKFCRSSGVCGCIPAGSS
jgi:DNA methylase